MPCVKEQNCMEEKPNFMEVFLGLEKTHKMDLMPTIYEEDNSGEDDDEEEGGVINQKKTFYPLLTHESYLTLDPDSFLSLPSNLLFNQYSDSNLLSHSNLHPDSNLYLHLDLHSHSNLQSYSETHSQFGLLSQSDLFSHSDLPSHFNLHSDSNLHSNLHSNSNPHAHSNLHSDSNLHSNLHLDSILHSNLHSDSNLHSHFNLHSAPNLHSNLDSDSNLHSNLHSDSNLHSHFNLHSNLNLHSESYQPSQSNLQSHLDIYSDLNPSSHSDLYSHLGSPSHSNLHSHLDLHLDPFFVNEDEYLEKSFDAPKPECGFSTDLQCDFESNCANPGDLWWLGVDKAPLFVNGVSKGPYAYWISEDEEANQADLLIRNKETFYDVKMLCDHPFCTSQQNAERVCHHPECVQNATNGKGLLLCKECDTSIHHQPGFNGHLVLDLPKSFKNESSEKVHLKKRDLQEVKEMELPAINSKDVEEEILDEDSVDGLGFAKNPNNSTRSSAIEKRLKRKDAVKRKSSVGNAKDRARSKSLSAMEIQSDVYLLETPHFHSDERSVTDSGHRHLSLPGTAGNGFLQVFFDPGEEKSVKITALKGKSIQELLSPQLEHHNIDISCINIYLESSHTPLPMNSDAGYLEGTNLFIKAKDGSPEISPLTKEKDNKRNSTIAIAKSRRANNLSVDDSSLTLKGARPLFITNKQKDKEKLDTMLEVLKNAVMQQPPATILELEPSWRNIVENSSELPKEVQSQQEVIWELLCTEATYIESLKVITNLFMCCLRNVQDKLPAIMKEIECDKLFSNIVDVINANSTLWKDYLSLMLQESRETKKPLDPSLMKEGFKKFPEIFYPYQRFCSEQIVCQNYIKEKLKSNEYFKNFVTWAEGNTNLCRRLRLIDIIIKPMQRLTRYALLLRRIKEKSTIEEQKEDLQEMITTVEMFVGYVNLVVGQRREQEKLRAMASRIDSYETVEAPNDECVKFLQNYNARFNLQSPMPGCGDDQSRIMVHHANLKYKDATTRLDVECYIFTDLFLICKSKKVNERLKVLKPPLKIDRISINELKDKGSILVIQLNDYGTPQMAFTLQAEPSVMKIWIEKLHLAREMYKFALHAASVHQQQHNFENELSDESNERIVCSKVPQMPYPFLYGRAEKMSDPCLSPKLSNKDRPASLSSLHKPKQRNATSDPSVSPMIVCQSPSPEHQTDPIMPSLNSELKTSHSMSSRLMWNNSAISEEVKGKIDRNRKTEKRYFTADSIQEIKRQEQADSSIHKRLSWNLGTVKTTDCKQILSKHMSSDSIPSSSGVSSTGSTHLSPDHEGNENEETTEPVSHQDPLLLETRASNNSLSLNTESRSKSMSDIALLLQDVAPSEMKDGISSVDLPKEINYSGLTPAQILNIKKYLLLNTTNESEV